MDIQNCLLCILYIILIIVHSFTLSRKDFHRKLISVFSLALFLQTVSTLLVTYNQFKWLFSYVNNNNISNNNYNDTYDELKSSPIDSAAIPKTYFKNNSQVPIFTIQDVAQLLHVTSINLLILFLLIVAKGWPITRRDMPFKYAFAIFWLVCLFADLINSYWTHIETLALNMISRETSHPNNSTIESTDLVNMTIQSSTTKSPLSVNDTIIPSPNQQDGFDLSDSTTKRLSLVIRIVMMLYFLLELRKTMILEQEQRKLQFYLHFGALSMVWFIHSVIVYAISLRVDKWQGKLVSGFSSAADFLAFAVTTRLLWPLTSRSLLFRRIRKQTSLEEPTIRLDTLILPSKGAQ